MKVYVNEENESFKFKKTVQRNILSSFEKLESNLEKVYIWREGTEEEGSCFMKLFTPSDLTCSYVKIYNFVCQAIFVKNAADNKKKSLKK